MFSFIQFPPLIGYQYSDNHYKLILPIFDPHVNGIIQYVLSCQASFTQFNHYRFIYIVSISSYDQCLGSFNFLCSIFVKDRDDGTFKFTHLNAPPFKK